MDEEEVRGRQIQIKRNLQHPGRSQIAPGVSRIFKEAAGRASQTTRCEEAGLNAFKLKYHLCMVRVFRRLPAIQLCRTLTLIGVPPRPSSTLRSSGAAGNT